MEPEARFQKIKQTIMNKKVNFNILLDEQTGNDYNIASLYNVTSIPTKIIIDKKGKIYSTLVGFNGNDEELVKELKSIVETLR
jgi:thioredoxin-related protein